MRHVNSCYSIEQKTAQCFFFSLFLLKFIFVKFYFSFMSNYSIIYKCCIKRARSKLNQLNESNISSKCLGIWKNMHKITITEKENFFPVILEQDF